MNHIAKTSSLTLPPYIEQKLNALVLEENLPEAVIALRKALLETFYQAIDGRCHMCGGSGLYRSVKGKRTIEDGCDECGGTGQTSSWKNAIRYGKALEILCGRRTGSDDTAGMSASEFSAAVLDGKIKLRD